MHTLRFQEGDRPEIQFGGAGQGGGDAAPTGQGTAEPAQGPAGEQQGGGGSSSFWIMLALLFAFMWFFVIRPESKRQKARKQFQSELKKGDRVVTAGGLHGSVAAIDDHSVTLKVADNVRLKFDRNAIGRHASDPAEDKPGEGAERDKK